MKDELEEILYKTIQSIIESKKAQGIEPSHATRMDVSNYVNLALNGLYHKRKIIVGPTVNDKYIKLAE